MRFCKFVNLAMTIFLITALVVKSVAKPEPEPEPPGP
jgi:hypothetical protein